MEALAVGAAFSAGVAQLDFQGPADLASWLAANTCATESISSMTVLITGAAGLIGAAVYERLLARSKQLVGIDNLKPGHCGVEHFVYASSSFGVWRQPQPAHPVSLCAATKKAGSNHGRMRWNFTYISVIVVTLERFAAWHGNDSSSSTRMTQTDTTAPPPQSTRTHLLGICGHLSRHRRIQLGLLLLVMLASGRAELVPLGALARVAPQQIGKHQSSQGETPGLTALAPPATYPQPIDAGIGQQQHHQIPTSQNDQTQSGTQPGQTHRFKLGRAGLQPGHR